MLFFVNVNEFSNINTATMKMDFEDQALIYTGITDEDSSLPQSQPHSACGLGLDPESLPSLLLLLVILQNE